MKKMFLLALLLAGSVTAMYANPGDTTIVQAQYNTQLSYYGDYDSVVAMPAAAPGVTYRKIYMVFTLGKYVCPGNPQYCGDWDYTVQTYFMAKHATDTMELGRFMTPYAHTGTGRFTATWTNRYIYDVTDYYPALKDTGTIRIHYSGYSGGFTANVKFVFVEGTPERNVTGIQRLWHGDFNYGHGSVNINDALDTLTNTPPSGTVSSEMKMNVTGHGGDDYSCAEFCPNYYTLSVGSNQVAQQQIFRNSCSANELYPQSGTWIYSRANWCPGALVHPFTHVLPIVAGISYKTKVDFPAYNSTTNNANTFAASYTIDASIFNYGAINKTVDASLEDIISPSDAEYHFRENPVAGKPEITVRNTGATPITAITFQYGIAGHTMQTYNWTGLIPALTSTDLSLPELTDLRLTTGTYAFKAFIQQVNGQADNDPLNDTLSSTFAAAPMWPTSFIVQFYSNDEGLNGSSSVSETAWRIEDMNGNIVRQKSDCPLNTICTDTVSLAAGYAYRFIITDSSVLGYYSIPDSDYVGVAQGDGLTGYSNTNGFLKVRKLQTAISNLPLAGNNSSADFGSGLVQEFYTGDALSIANQAKTTAILKAFPNPAGNKLNVYIDGLQQAGGTLRLIDVMGRMVHEEVYQGSLQAINTSTMAAGVYQLTYMDNEGAAAPLQSRITIAR